MTDAPKHAGEGVLYGVRDLGKGVWGGVSGVVTQPMKGAKREGGLGFLKGVGKGVAGVVTKPITGVTDLISQTTKGVRNTTIYWDSEHFAPKRPQRAVGRDLALNNFSERNSHGSSLMRKVLGAKHAHDEFYVNHAENHSWLLTTKRIYRIGKHDDILESWPTAALKPHSSEESSLGLLFSTKAKDKIFIECVNSRKKIIKEQIEELIEFESIFA